MNVKGHDVMLAFLVVIGGFAQWLRNGLSAPVATALPVRCTAWAPSISSPPRAWHPLGGSGCQWSEPPCRWPRVEVMGLCSWGRLWIVVVVSRTPAWRAARCGRKMRLEAYSVYGLGHLQSSLELVYLYGGQLSDALGSVFVGLSSFAALLFVVFQA